MKQISQLVRELNATPMDQCLSDPRPRGICRRPSRCHTPTVRELPLQSGPARHRSDRCGCPCSRIERNRFGFFPPNPMSNSTDKQPTTNKPWKVLRSSGVSVLMSTHYIEEAERLCDDVAVVSHGKVIARGTPAELVGIHAGVEALEFFGPPVRLQRVEDTVAPLGFSTRRTGPSVSVLRAEALPQHVVDALGEGSRRAANLEDVFVLLTGERLAD